MSSIHADEQALATMAQKDLDGPVVMLNLLRYRERAESGHGVDGLTGEEAYRFYGREFAKLNPRFGGEPIWMGLADQVVVGREDWDVVILVRYPSRAAFVSMMSDPDYQAIAPIRAAALADSRLIETDQLLPKLDR
ncbi:MAG: DUF1330 domain-containing protein [Acidimicrobiales bacterium]